MVDHRRDGVASSQRGRQLAGTGPDLPGPRRRCTALRPPYGDPDAGKASAPRRTGKTFNRTPRRSAFLCAKQHDRDGAIRL
jgi:hypothetical protein